MSPPSQRFNSRTLIALCIVALLAVCFWPRRNEDILNVPLGVEQAAIVSYSGPVLAVKPFKWGVAVNVRIAKVSEEAGGVVSDREARGRDLAPNLGELAQRVRGGEEGDRHSLLDGDGEDLADAARGHPVVEREGDPLSRRRRRRRDLRRGGCAE